MANRVEVDVVITGIDTATKQFSTINKAAQDAAKSTAEVSKEVAAGVGGAMDAVSAKVTSLRSILAIPGNIAGGFISGAVAELRAMMKSSDDAAASLKKFKEEFVGPLPQGKVQTAASSLATEFLKANLIFEAGKIAVGFLFDEFKRLKDITTDAQQLQLRLEGIEKALGSAGTIGAQSLRRLAEELKATTLLNDDDVIKAGASLIGFQNLTRETVERVIRDSANLAAFLGRDLASTVQTLGKAIEDPIQGMAALGRAGIKLTDQQKDQVKSFVDLGEITKAQGILFEEVERRTNGLAASMATGLAKSAVDNTRAFEDLYKAVGAIAFSSTTREVGALATAVSFLTKQIDILKDAGSNIPESLQYLFGGNAQVIVAANQRAQRVREARAEQSREANRGAAFGPQDDPERRRIEIDAEAAGARTREIVLSLRSDREKADDEINKAAALYKKRLAAVKEGSEEYNRLVAEAADVEERIRARLAKKETRGAGGSGDDGSSALRRAERREELQAIKDSFDEEIAIAERAQITLKAAFDRRQLDELEYITQRQAAIETADNARIEQLKAVLAEEDLQIAAQRERVANATKEKDRNSAQTELLGLLDKRRKAVEDLEKADTKAITNVLKGENDLRAAIERRGAALQSASDRAQRSLYAELKASQALLEELEDIASAADKVAERQQLDLSTMGKTREQAELARVEYETSLAVREATLVVNRAIVALADAERNGTRDDVSNAERELEIAKKRLEVAEKIAKTTVDFTKQKQGGEEFLAQLQEVDRVGKYVWEGLVQSGEEGFKRLKESLKKTLVDYVYTAFVKPILLSFATSVFGGGGGGIQQILGNVLGGGGGGGGFNFGGLLSQFSDTIFGGLSSAAEFLGLGTSQASAQAANALGFLGESASGLAGAFGEFGAALGGGLAANIGTLGTALSSGISAAGGFAAVLGSAVPVIGAVFALASALGLFDNETGTKIDNSVRDGRGRKDIIDSALGSFDVSGDVGNDAYAPLIKYIQGFDKVIADTLLSEGDLEEIRARIQGISSDATDWFGYDDEASLRAAIEKASKLFLQQRYGTAFDVIDPAIAARIRNFEGTTDELIAFIGKVITLTEAFDALGPRFDKLGEYISDIALAPQEVQAAFGSILDYLNSDFGEKLAEFFAGGGDGSNFTSIAGPSVSVSNAWRKLGEEIISYTDFSTDGLVQLAALTQQRYETELALVNEIINVSRAAADAFKSDALGFEEEVIRLRDGDAGLFEFYDKQIAALRDELATTTDVTRINQIAGELSRFDKASFALLSPEEKIRLGQDFIDLSEENNRLVQDALRKVNDEIIAQRQLEGATVAAALLNGAEQAAAALRKGGEDAAAAINGARVGVDVTTNSDGSTTVGIRQPNQQESGNVANYDPLTVTLGGNGS